MKKFFKDTTAATTSYVEVKFGFLASKMTLVSNDDSDGDLLYSFDNATTDEGRLKPGEPFTEQGDGFRASSIWVKKENAADTVNYRIWARAK